MKITGKFYIYINNNFEYPLYSISLSNRDHPEDRMWIRVKFTRDATNVTLKPGEEKSTEIEVLDAFLVAETYTDKQGNDHTQPIMYIKEWIR